MWKSFLDFLKAVLDFFIGKNELKRKEMEIKNAEEFRKIEERRQENEFRDKIEKTVKDEDVEELRKIISNS